MQETSKIQRQVTVTCENGLHLNPISQLVRRAVSFGSTISLSFDGRRADVKSAFDLMLLAAPAGAVLDLEVTGPDAEQASESIIRLFESGFPGPGLPSH
ncbi:MAG: HPr family phosphocarrier protein [Planctomycetia bacterium]